MRPQGSQGLAAKTKGVGKKIGGNCKQTYLSVDKFQLGVSLLGHIAPLFEPFHYQLVLLHLDLQIEVTIEVSISQFKAHSPPLCFACLLPTVTTQHRRHLSEHPANVSIVF